MIIKSMKSEDKNNELLKELNILFKNSLLLYSPTVDNFYKNLNHLQEITNLREKKMEKEAILTKNMKESIKTNKKLVKEYTEEIEKKQEKKQEYEKDLKRLKKNQNAINKNIVDLKKENENFNDTIYDYIKKKKNLEPSSDLENTFKDLLKQYHELCKKILELKNKAKPKPNTNFDDTFDLSNINGDWIKIEDYVRNQKAVSDNSTQNISQEEKKKLLDKKSTIDDCQKLAGEIDNKNKKPDMSKQEADAEEVLNCTISTDDYLKL